jgi:hypothetical protein
MSSTGRTWRHPTEACAYQVPFVPCFDEGHRLAIALHGHHDVEPRFAHFPHVALQRGVSDLHHAAGEAEVAHQLGQLPELAQ